MANEATEQSRRQTDAQRKRASNWGPIIIILVVSTVIFLAVNVSNNGADGRFKSSESTFNANAFMSSIDGRNDSRTFRGGKASAMMGGVNLDFRDAVMEGDEATIEVSVIMGGVDIRVPRSWTVVNHVTPILGGADDNTRPSDANKRLIVEGTVLMGGLDIKN